MRKSICMHTLYTHDNKHMYLLEGFESPPPSPFPVTGCHTTCCWGAVVFANKRGSLASQRMLIEPIWESYRGIKFY